MISHYRIINSTSVTWELKSRQSPRTYADLIGIVALRIIEIGDQSTLRFPSLSVSFPFVLLRHDRVCAPPARSHYYVRVRQLRNITRNHAATKEIGGESGSLGHIFERSQLGEREGIHFARVSERRLFGGSARIIVVRRSNYSTTYGSPEVREYKVSR